MIVISAAVVLLPFVLMFGLNGRNEADSRGRRLDRTWRTHHR